MCANGKVLADTCHLEENTMTRIVSAIVASTFIVGLSVAGVASAQDAMQADPMKKDSMQTDTMSKDGMKSATMTTGSTKADCMHQADMETDAMKKSEMMKACDAMK
jgi:pentapeptide MXKDX repeat protein